MGGASLSPLQFQYVSYMGVTGLSALLPSCWQDGLGQDVLWATSQAYPRAEQAVALRRHPSWRSGYHGHPLRPGRGLGLYSEKVPEACHPKRA